MYYHKCVTVFFSYRLTQLSISKKYMANLLHEKQPKNQPEILRLISDVRKRFLFLRLVSQCFLI